MARSRNPEEIIEKYGVPLKYDPEFKGPTKRRSCTDVICLLLFVVFIIVWIGIAGYAYRYGDPSKLLVAIDSKGKRCGLDSDVLDKKNLLFFDLSKCASPKVLYNGCSTTQICVNECPTHTWSSLPYRLGDIPFNLKDVQSNLICTDDNVKQSVTSREKLVSTINDGLCADWYIGSTAIHGRCVPVSGNSTDARVYLEAFKLAVKHISISIRESLSNYTDDDKINEFGTYALEDLINSWPYIIAAVAIAALVCLLVIIMLRWIACIVTWLTLIAIVALLAVGAYFSYRRFDYLNKHGPDDIDSRMIKGQIDELGNSKGLFMFLTILLGVLAIIALLIIIFLRKRITIAITLIKEGSKAVSSITSTLFFPIVPWIGQAVVILWAIGVGIFLASIGNPVFKVHGLTGSTCICSDIYSTLKNGNVCDAGLFEKYCHNVTTQQSCTTAGCKYYGREVTTVTVILQLFNAFGAFWGVWFVSGVSYMIMAATFATWYWTWNKRDVPFFTLTYATARTLRYHLGTVAFGSLLISICSFMRALIEYTENKLKKYENPIAKALFCCLRCFFWCLEKFLRFVSRNAYIMCAIHGKNFCISAKDAFNLLMRNVIRVVVLDKVTDFLFFVAKLFVTAIVVTGSYFLLFQHSIIQLHYIWLPLVIIGVSSFLVSTVFFGVYAMAVDTLFLCFLEDCERNDGSREKPYFMSKSLMQILGKRNKQK